MFLQSWNVELLQMNKKLKCKSESFHFFTSTSHISHGISGVMEKGSFVQKQARKPQRCAASRLLLFSGSEKSEKGLNMAYRLQVTKIKKISLQWIHHPVK